MRSNHQKKTRRKKRVASDQPLTTNQVLEEANSWSVEEINEPEPRQEEQIGSQESPLEVRRKKRRKRMETAVPIGRPLASPRV